MTKFLTGASRIQQTDRKRVWMLLDNELFQDSKGELLLAPRSMYTDNYTIPCWVAWIAGSPVDFDVRASHIHDLGCDCHEIVRVTLTEEELKNKGFLRYLSHKGLWICEDIPAMYLDKRPVSKKEINDILYECMEAAGVPKINRGIIRAGVCFNLMWYVDQWLGHVFDIDLNRIYEESYWNEKVWY